MPQHAEMKDILRYERKFLVTAFSHAEIEQLLHFHPSCFSEIFHQRRVNNIYFDTPGMDNYYDNVEGEKERTKVRIRWYGELFGTASKPVLEFKIKKGLLGKKESYQMLPFLIEKGFDITSLKQESANSLPQHVRLELVSSHPVLLNSYKRKYFLSADKKFRVTVDHDLTYYRISSRGNLFLNKITDHVSSVVELKYDAADELLAKEVATHFKFPLTKNSKYLRGVENVLF